MGARRGRERFPAFRCGDRSAADPFSLRRRRCRGGRGFGEKLRDLFAVFRLRLRGAVEVCAAFAIHPAARLANLQVTT